MNRFDVVKPPLMNRGFLAWASVLPDAETAWRLCDDPTMLLCVAAAVGIDTRIIVSTLISLVDRVLTYSPHQEYPEVDNVVRTVFEWTHNRASSNAVERAKGAMYRDVHSPLGATSILYGDRPFPSPAPGWCCAVLHLAHAPCAFEAMSFVDDVYYCARECEYGALETVRKSISWEMVSEALEARRA